MNNLDLIIEKILSEAKAEAEAIIARSYNEAADIASDTESKVGIISKAAERRCFKEYEDAIRRAEGTADMKKREIILKTKVGLIEKAFSEAEKRIFALSTEEYSQFLSKLIADAVRDRLDQVAEMKELYGEDEDNDYCTSFSVTFNKKDKKEFSAEAVKNAKLILKKRIAIAIETKTADISGGVIIRYGDIETNCSVEALLNEARANCEAQVANILFAAPAAE